MPSAHFNLLSLSIERNFHFIKKNRHSTMVRCSICDYTHEEGSDYASLLPGRFKVHKTDEGDYLCSECLAEIEETLEGYGYDDEDEQD